MRKFKEEILLRGLWTIRISFVVTLTPAGPTHHSWLAAAAQYSATRPLTRQYTQNRAVYRTWTSAQLVSRQSQVATESSPLLGFSRTQSLLTASLADLQTKSCWIDSNSGFSFVGEKFYDKNSCTSPCNTRCIMDYQFWQMVWVEKQFCKWKSQDEDDV